MEAIDEVHFSWRAAHTGAKPRENNIDGILRHLDSAMFDGIFDRPTPAPFERDKSSQLPIGGSSLNSTAVCMLVCHGGCPHLTTQRFR